MTLDHRLETAAPIAALPYRAPRLAVERRADGAILLRSVHEPREEPVSIAHLFEERARAHAERPFLLRRGYEGRWEGPSYGAMRRDARAIARWLIERRLPGTGGVMILSGNSIEHAAMMLGCYYSGTASTALSQAFSMASADFSKLEHCFRTIEPRLIFVQSGAQFGRALAYLSEIDPTVEIVTVEATGDGQTEFSALLAMPENGAVDSALAALDRRTVAKYLFTSGSTGMPKAVPQTHGMMTAMIAARHGLMADPEARLPGHAIDWMPWSHLSAGNIGFNHNIWAGGTLYIDDGRPVRGGFTETISNLVELQPPSFASAPIAFEMLANALESDAEAAERFFDRLTWMAYGGAALSQDIADRLQQLALLASGRRIPIVTTYGATEVQGITTVHWPTDRVGLLGVPLPGVTLKLAPVNGKLEIRVKGPTVMTGYLGNPEANAAAFDAEGFYRLGDAACFADEDDPLQGLRFDGRISEDFKLSSGTWVSVGTLRTALVEAASPLILDAVITGQDKPFAGALVWVPADQAAGADFAERLRQLVAAFNRQQGGSSRRVERMLVEIEPPSIADGEVTEKGYINQRRVIERRSAAVARLYAAEVDADVIVVD